ncbi:energy transducer TonB [Endozoicomonas sp.]|uniref:energy transducer TonB n=1 Tax=Endozoicomonas sp. TaxID=1892382 RepID=UPI003AF4BC24
MNHYTTKSIAAALLCSVALHLVFVLIPKDQQPSLISEHKGTSEFKLTLARNTKPTAPSPAPLKNTAKKEQLPSETEESNLPEKSQFTQNTKQTIATKSMSKNNISPSAKNERAALKTAQPKEINTSNGRDKTEPRINSSQDHLAFNNNDDGLDYSTEIPAESKQSNAITSWQSDLIQRINQQKRYPRQALRRGIEGDVTVRAIIQPDGSLVSAEMLSGDQRFKVSSLQAVSRALPFAPPASVLQPITVSFIIHYTIN